MLGALVRDGLLASEGSGRGMTYRLPWQRRDASALFNTADAGGDVPPESVKPPELDTKPPELEIFQDWALVPRELQAALAELAKPVAERKHARAPTVRQTIQALCTGRFLGLRVLAHVLRRDPDDLRKRTLTPMVQEGVLATAFPSPRDPRQAYTVPPTPTES